MKDYEVTITYTCGITAKDEAQAQERAQKIEDALTMQFTSPAGKPAKPPSWFDSDTSSSETTIEEA